MKDFRYDDPELFEAFLKSAQYLVSIKSRRDVWEHLGRLIASHFPAHWTAFARRDEENGISILHGTLTGEDAARLILDDTARSMVADVLDCGFPATKIIPVPVPSMTAALPIIERNQPQMVLLIGHRSTDPVPKDLFNIYLAVAGLAGASFERLQSEEELNRYHARLEDLVKERTAELARAKRQNELILHSVGEGICGLDLEGNITFVNPSAAQLVGWTPNELIGRNAHAAFHHTRIGGCVYPAEECPVHLAMVNGDAKNVIGEEFLRKDGTAFPVELTTSPMVEDGRVVGAVVTFRDITERKAAEEKILKLSEEAQAANQAKSIFLANMSHEIRTPMNGVLGMIELAMRKSRDAQVREYLELSKESALNLLDIINDILDLSKIEAGKMKVSCEPFALRKVLEYTFEPFAIAARRKGLTLDYTVDRGVPDRVMGDAGRLRQVLNNLLGNALKFTAKGGIDVFVESIEEKSERNTTCRFSIRDTGVGIPAEKLEAVFDSFEQAHASSAAMCGGTGLGLAISKRLVEIMGGEITVRSRENIGSTFTFTIVFDLPETFAEEEKTFGAERYFGRPLRILVAEDNRLNRIFIQAILQASGHTVVLAETGRAAIETMAKDSFDVVLMDIRMPEMDGDEATRIIRNQPPEGVSPNVPIIAMTAYALKDEIDQYMQSGFNAYLTKPIEVDKLNKILAEL